MKKFIPILTVPTVMIVLACMIIPVYAVPGGNAGFQGGKMGGGMTNPSLNHLEEQGFDVTAIRTAIESGDMDTARSLMRQFMEEHRDELPAPPEREDRMTTQLDQLEEQGYDVTAIRTAIESGDMDTARSLMRQFMEEHRDELPAPPEREDRMTTQLDQLEEQGYDVTAIRTAIESGDMDTARSLMRQFMEEHRDELPAPPGMEKLGRGIAGIRGIKTA